MSKRKQHAPEFKAKVALEALKGEEAYVKVRGDWCYLYRAVDRNGKTIDFMLSEHRRTGPPQHQETHPTDDWLHRIKIGNSNLGWYRSSSHDQERPTGQRLPFRDLCKPRCLTGAR